LKKVFNNKAIFMTASGNDVPTNINFADDVKSDRLSILWQVTSGVSIMVLVLMFTFVTTENLSVAIWVLSPIALIAGSTATRILLAWERINLASLAYTLGGVLAVAVAMTETNPTTAQIVPFALIIVVFMAGLLLSPFTTVMVGIGSAVLTIAVPALSAGTLEIIGPHQIFAIVMMMISLLMALQVTGELYAVTEWALSNYERERLSNRELFENRNQLRISLRRSEVLGEQLQSTNAELAEAKEAAEAAKKFRGQFLANMSHELRTPLNAIIGFSETMLKFPMMYDDEELPEAYRNDLNQIFTSGQQLLSLINDILDLARVDAGKLEIYMEQVSLDPVIEAVKATANGLVSGKPIELTFDLPEPLPMVWADETRVRQVLLNLYSNATKFTDSGSIDLKITSVEEGVQFSIRDTGRGIPADKLSAIFEEFTQAEDKGGRDPRAGSGLGLAISRQLLDLMRGHIWAESVVGEGSTFYFTLQPYHKAHTETTETQMLSTDDNNTIHAAVPAVTDEGDA
jgi:signal transduction histidine kinase